MRRIVGWIVALPMIAAAFIMLWLATLFAWSTEQD